MSRKQALQANGYSDSSLHLFSDSRFRELLSDERSLLESELIDSRQTLAYELLQLARDPATPAASRISAYRTLGKWAGLDRGPELQAPGLPGPTQDVVVPAEYEVESVVSTLRAKHRK